ncbi:MAG: MerR family transcriptional regulator [Oscillospiraceae bacterium]|nr:MerR family transcriptional regulator [Oscillospiraceae bacterium]MBQ4556877.1 MerR family transcriptional regulator [Clostridia bacterium]
MNEKKLFSIGEIANAIGITRRIILNYEAKGLIVPDKKDGSSANRYYTIDTFTQIRTIRVFQDLGLSLDEIREYFEESSDLASVIKRLETMRDKLNLAIEKLKERTCKSNDTIEEITVPPQTIYRRIYNTSSIEDKTNLLRDTALEAMRKHGTDVTKRMYFTEYDVHSLDEISYCVAVPPESEGEYIENIPTLRALSIYHHGAYEAIPETRKKLFSYAKEAGITLSGTYRHVYLEGPPQHKDKSRFITQILAIVF